jgi:hypothetical protein
VGGEIFRTRPYRPCGPPSLLYNGYRVSFPGVKWPGRGVNHPPPTSAEVKEGGAIALLHLWAFVACSRVNFGYSHSRVNDVKRERSSTPSWTTRLTTSKASIHFTVNLFFTRYLCKVGKNNTTATREVVPACTCIQFP